MALYSRSTSFLSRGGGPSASELVTANLLRERSTRIVPLERAAEATRRTLAALDGLRAPVEDLRLAARAMSLDPGIALGAASSNETVAVGVGSENATPGTYEVTLSSVARGSSFSFAATDTPFNSLQSNVVQKVNDALPEKDRSITFTFGTDATPESIALPITSTTTIENFVEKFNGASSRATAELVNIGTETAPNYSILIRSNNIGTTLGTLAVDIGEGLVDPNGDGDKSDNPFRYAVSVQADNARFSVGGIAGGFERESNTVTDAIDGVTLLLRAPGETTLTVSAETGTATSRAQALVSALNRLGDFIDARNGFEERSPERGGGVAPGPLRSTRVDDLLQGGLRGDLRGLSRIGSGALSVPELGITTNRSGRLEFDETTFRDAILSSPKEANASLKALGARLESTIDAFDGSNGLIDMARTRSLADLDRYESSIAAIERRLEDRTLALTNRYSRIEGTLARLSSQGMVLTALFPGGVPNP